MAAVKWNQDINAGQDWLANINILNADATGRDITGHTIDSKVKRHYKSASHKAVLTITVIDAASGNVSLGLSAAQTAILKNGKWLYDVELTKTETGEVDRVIEGYITIRPEITTN
jgi:hypothetical protein